MERNHCFGKFLQIFSKQRGEKEDLSPEEKVMRVLYAMDKTNPQRRARNVWDKRFAQLVPELHLYDRALEFINTYGHVCDTYIQLLAEPEKNAELQFRLCKVAISAYSDRYRAKYPNVLWGYLGHYDLLPEVKSLVLDDAKYEHIAEIYKLRRQ